MGKIKNKFKYGIVFIAGNHDWGFQIDSVKSRALINNAIYLEDETIEINGLKIYGSPWQPFFYNWAFNLHRGEEIKKKWDMISENTDILLTHGPVFGILDRVNRNGGYKNEPVGCEELRKKVDNLPNLKLHICGHIHEEYGLLDKDEKKFVNASILNDKYQVAHKPIIVEI